MGWAPAAILFAVLAPLATAQTDIRSFGARCDGSDDSAAIQAALNAIPNGGTVTIPCSAGIGSRGIVLANKSNVTVAGVGAGSGFLALATTSLGVGGFGPVLFKVSACSNCVIKDLTIDNRNLAVVGVGFEICSGSTLQNVSVSNTGYPANAAIVASGGNGNSFLGNTVQFTQKVSNDGTRGMWIGNGGSQTEQNVTIANNTVSNVGATGIATHVNNANIRNNLVTNAAGAGIKVTPTTGLGGSTTVQGNTLRGNLYHGIQISKADSPVIIQQNTIDGNNIAGIYAADGAFYGRITGNTITNQPQAGIYLYNADNLSVDNNQISGNGHGILLEAPSGYNLNGLTIASNTISSQSAHGITMWGRGGSISSVSITSNSIYNGSLYGMFIEQLSGSISGVSASSNCFSNNASGTIYDNRSQIAPVASSASCAPSTSDKTPPSVAVTAPANGATVSGTITVTATASDNIGVAGVQFYLNGSPFGPKLTSAPYSAQWDTRTVGNGSYQWTAMATDAAGNSATSTVVFAQVSNSDVIAPTVRILTPAGGAVTGVVGLTASASDNIGVAGVQWAVKGSPLGAEVTTSPYAYSWNTAGLAAGNYTISATARDAAGNRSSASVTVSINDTTPPTVRITSPAAGATVGGTISLTAAASDNVGVAGVQFLVDGAAYGAESTSGFSISCNTTYLSNGSHTISAVARDAAGNKTIATGVSVTVSNSSGAVQSPTTTTTITPVVRVNSGGGAYTDPSGNVWAADSNYSGGYPDAPGKAISGTTTPALYADQRWAPSTLTYDFAVANGTYIVNLKFAEIYFSGTGQRVFNIAINGQAVLNNFDIVAAAGGPTKAVDRSFTINVTGGRVTIQMVSTVDDPAVNAIEILKVTTTTTTTPTTPPATSQTMIRVNAGGGAYTDPSGNVWAADSNYSGGVGYAPGKAISGTTTPALYASARWAKGSLSYDFSVPNGTYTVTLKFAELYWSAAGQRLMNIAINGQAMINSFDILAAAGGPTRAVDRSFTVNVTGGRITIKMTATVDNPTVNAIEIR